MPVTLDSLLREMILWSAGFVAVATVLLLAPSFFRRRKPVPQPVIAADSHARRPLPPNRGT
jgi:hypothetical protein